jgi:hypothetical protein
LSSKRMSETQIFEMCAISEILPIFVFQWINQKIGDYGSNDDRLIINCNYNELNHVIIFWRSGRIGKSR